MRDTVCLTSDYSSTVVDARSVNHIICQTFPFDLENDSSLKVLGVYVRMRVNVLRSSSTPTTVILKTVSNDIIPHNERT